MRSPWTHEELDAMLRSTRQHIDQTESEYPDARPLPPLTEDEAFKMLNLIAETAAERALTPSECFLHGQLLAAFKMAILAVKLGRPPGRYYVIAEADIPRLTNAGGGEI